MKGWKRGFFKNRFFSKNFSEVNFGQNLIIIKVFMSNSILLNRMALTESRFGAQNMKIDLLPPNILLSVLRILEALKWKGKENRPLVGVGFDPFRRFSCYGPKIEKIKLEPVRGCSEESFSTPGRSHTPSLYLAKNRFLNFSPSPKYSLTEGFIQCSKVNSKENAHK